MLLSPILRSNGQRSLLLDDMDRMFATMFGSDNARWVPAVDIADRGDHFLVRADLPGLKADDVTVELHERTLTLAGNRQTTDEVSRENFYRLERSQGTFRRSLTLPADVDGEKVKASFANGVLEVTVPKKPESVSRKIPVKSGR